MNTISYPSPRFYPTGILLLIFLAFIVYKFSTLLGPSPPGIEYLRNNKDQSYDKTSGKNGKHSNPDARRSAEQKIEKVKEEIDRLVQKPGKSKEDAKQLEKLRDQLKHLRKKKDWSGETHSRTGKGN